MLGVTLHFGPMIHLASDTQAVVGQSDGTDLDSARGR